MNHLITSRTTSSYISVPVSCTSDPTSRPVYHEFSRFENIASATRMVTLAGCRRHFPLLSIDTTRPNDQPYIDTVQGAVDPFWPLL